VDPLLTSLYRRKEYTPKFPDNPVFSSFGFSKTVPKKFAPRDLDIVVHKIFPSKGSSVTRNIKFSFYFCKKCFGTHPYMLLKIADHDK
jgi:hypothetical protein